MLKEDTKLIAWYEDEGEKILHTWKLNVLEKKPAYYGTEQKPRVIVNHAIASFSFEAPTYYLTIN